MFSNDFTETFGIKHPIVCGGMTAVGTADLIAAVANAGALGFRGARSPEGPHRRGHGRGLWWAGQSQGLIHEVDTCAAVVEKIMREAEEIISTRLLGQLVR